MKRLLLALLALSLTACGTWLNRQPSVGPPSIAEGLSSPGTLAETPATEPTAQPVGAEISDDPTLSRVAELVADAGKDAATADQIAALTDDKIMHQCATFLTRPETAARVTALLSFKSQLQILPIKPTGPLSLIAEKRRVGRDIASGALSRLVSEKRKALDELKVDARLACAALLLDEADFGGKIRQLIRGVRGRD